ncbi:hypothetical protein KPH14_009002 [Odynerus spinipes]|uniref:limulus clotting factor C n=1 Tax=Odynerus spinipes TaxID=1348599 RepID=A0AAD9RNJ2_9HYME|nr:hypothetical protein KPH14_009002 [Odynerus spinipes]
MMFWTDRFYIALCVVHLGTFTFAIYDPRATTTAKPQNRRQPSLPWYLDEKNLQPPDDLVRSAKWWTDTEETRTRKPVVVNSGTKSWTPWRKNPGSEIEQRSEVNDDQIYAQHQDQDQFDQIDAWKPPPVTEDQYGYSTTSKDGLIYQGHENHGNNAAGKEPKLSLGTDQQFLYEEVPTDSTKPRKERILVSTSPKLTVAHYDPESGVQCPTLEATGQFVYPPDCKFFVNCWKGRAFVQPCAPGTLFNPQTLECDFPHKVKCYGIEISDLTSTHYSDAYTSQQDAKRVNFEKPRCPPHVTGLTAHPTSCTKFLQCANGGTIEMNCGPGTVFNPAISVCDWPYNVRGCEDTFKPEATTQISPQVPPELNFHNHHSNAYDERLEYTEQPARKKVECPPGATGLFPHPETCKKFLQCANGMTYVMDCGPGTAFNPLVSVCDWPYNVPACKEEKTVKQVTTTSRPWPPYTHEDTGPWHDHHRHDHTLPDHQTSWGQGSSNTGRFQPPTTTELPRPIYKPVTWRPKPDYSRLNPQNQDGSVNYQTEAPPAHYHHHDHYPGSIENCNNTGQEASHQGPCDQQTYHHHHHHHHYHYGTHSGNEGTSVPNEHQPTSPTTRDVEETWNHDHAHRNIPPNPWTPANHPPPNFNDKLNSRQTPQGRGRNEFDSTHFVNRDQNQSMSSNRNVYVDHDYKLPDESESRNRTDRTYGTRDGPYFSRPNQIDNRWNRYNVSDRQWNQSEPFNRPTNRPWNQGSKYPPQVSGKPLYPHGIYVNINGTRGHFITEEVEINQGHSKIKTFNPNDPRIPFSSNQTYGSVYTRTPLYNQNNPNSSIVPSNRYPVEFKPNPVNNSKPFDGNFTNRSFNQSRSTGLQGVDSHYPSGDSRPVYGGAIDSAINRSITLPELAPHRANNRSIKQSDFFPLTSENVKKKKIPDVHSKPSMNRTSRVMHNVTVDENTTVDPNVPTVSIEDSNGSQFNDTKLSIDDHDLSYGDITDETIGDAFDVDVLEDKEYWKPVLVFENKTATRKKNESSVIMKINKKNTDVDLFNIEVAPHHDEEPPFSVYYIPPVQPLSSSKKAEPLTPISGQIIRLRGGSGPGDGYLEVQGAQPGWGIVCDSRNSWTLKEAHVVCRQLGFTRGAEMAWQGRNKRNGMPSWIAANSVTCYGNETRFQSCKFTHGQECRVERDAVGIRCLPNRVAHCRQDEIPHEGECYHLAESDKELNHAEALSYCSKRGSRLIDITSQAENDFVSEWLLQLHPEIGSIMTSGIGFTTLNRTLWLWKDSSRAKFKFAKWWPGWMEDRKLPPRVGSRPVCIIMKRKFPCLNRPDSICVAEYFFWDVEDCASSMKGHSYICKRPYDDIGCVYGKDNKYFGTANVTASGAACLLWSDKRIRHYLTINVINNEVREKLKTHNYCRNPNSNREHMPWCFTGPQGQWEYCDIPFCGNVDSKRLHLSGQCKPKHFECLPGECIPAAWVCDGAEDCTNGADELACVEYLDLYQKYAKNRLEGYDVEKWLNTPLKTCALRCKEADFTCRSFAHKASENICLLSDSNIGLTGALKPTKEFDYYEMKERSINCNNMFVCENRKCINQTLVCNGKNDCNDRSDEKICTVENLDYDIRLAGSDNPEEGRIEVKIWGEWGQVCDDGFGMINAEVICKELGFPLGALKVKPGGFYGNLDPPHVFKVDQLKCRGNETSLRECDFDGWGVHDCAPEEAVGVVCKTAVDSCQEGYWKCDTSPECIAIRFICDVVQDCSDGSDESDEHCNAPFEVRLVNGSSPLEGRVEVRHHGIWGTICDDDFSVATARVICRSLGYGGDAKPKKDGFFGPGQGPIWLDEVSCRGNETQLYRCDHNDWGQNNCDHYEDAGVICSLGEVNNDPEFNWNTEPDLPEPNINDLLPADCGKRAEDFNYDEDLIFARVVHGSIAPKGTYPWQASIRIRGHSRSSHWCGAVILSPLHVLTAAHCLKGYNKGTYFVRAGDYNTEINEGTEQEANIEDYYIHEDFRKGHQMNNDIALVLLKGRGILLGKDIMPICLPPENADYPAGLNCTISGFGSIETGKTTPSKDLRYGWVPLLDQSICRAEYVYGQGRISDGMVCAGYLDEGVDTCDGDSGGPLACYRNGAFTLYGITSWGQHCGEANKPGVYVRVAHYRRWIDQKIRESLSGR